MQSRPSFAVAAVALIVFLVLALWNRQGAQAQPVPEPAQFSVSATVAAAYTDVKTVVVGGRGAKASIGLSNAADGAVLTDFRLQIQAHPDAAWESWIGGADWADSTIGSITFCSTTRPNTLAAGSTSIVEVVLPACYAFKVQAITGSSTTLTVRGTVAWD